MRTSILPIIAILALPTASFAGETAWQELAPDVTVRLISTGVVDADGSSQLALEIDMPQTTKTYWRVPGDTGFPLELDAAASRGVRGVTVDWPYPVRHEAGGNLDYAYFGHTVLPLTLAVDDPQGMVDLQATIAICSDICVPAQTRLSLPLSDARPDAANALRIRQALAEVPIAWTGAPDAVGAVRLAPDGTAVTVAVESSQVDPQSLIVAADAGEPLFGTPQKSPQNDLVVLPILGKSDNSALEGMDVELTFMTDTGAYVVNRTIESGADGAGGATGAS